MAKMPAEEDGMWLPIGAEMTSQSAKEAGKCSLSTGNSSLLLTIMGLRIVAGDTQETYGTRAL